MTGKVFSFWNIFEDKRVKLMLNAPRRWSTITSTVLLVHAYN